MKMRDYRFDVVNAEEENSAYGEQEMTAYHPRVSNAEVGNSAFRPKFGVFTLSAAEQIVLCSNGAIEQRYKDTWRGI